MATYYFDLYSGDNITIDEDGVDLSSLGSARRLALEMLGQTVLDGAARQAVGWISKIEVRDRSRLLLRISAAVLVDDLS